MPLSLTRRIGERLRFRVGDTKAWLTVIGFDKSDVVLTFVYEDAPEVTTINGNPLRPMEFRIAGKAVEIWVGERYKNQVRLSFAGDLSVEILREEIIPAPTGRKVSA